MTSNKSDTGEEVLIALLVGWIFGWGTGAVRALVFMKGWEWFIADTFDVLAIGFIPAWGLTMIVSFATLQLYSDSSDSKSGIVSRMIASLITSLFLSGLYFLSMILLVGFR